MNLELIGRMRCPYCTGCFTLSKENKSAGDRILYGLIECHCFEFPIVDGVLLLSLTKGYGGSEDKLIPYEPFMAAAIQYIKEDDLPGFEAWIKEKSPILSKLLFDNTLSYTEFNVEYSRDYNTHNIEFLEEQVNEYKVVGEKRGEGVPVNKSGQSLYPQSYEDMILCKLGRGGNYYVKRYFDPSVSVTRNFLLNNMPDDYLLSLCIGQGILENIAADHFSSDKLISMDAQLINLFIVKRFVHQEGLYICHNLYFPLPFANDEISATFTSTCLPELVNQANVMREISRVTRKSGWAYIEHIWKGKELRFAAGRFYRYLQNQFESFDQYLELLHNTCDSNAAFLSMYQYDGYKLAELDDFVPMSECASIEANTPDLVSVLLTDQVRKIGRSLVPLAESEIRRLRISPMFDSTREGKLLRGRIKDIRKDYMHRSLPTEFEVDLTKLDDGSYLNTLYEAGVLVLLPETVATYFPALNELVYKVEAEMA